MMRIKITGFILGLMFLFLALGLFNLQMLRGRQYRQLSDKNSIRVLPQEGSRGMIFDTNGELIASSRLTYDVMLMPQGSIVSRDDTIRKIAGVLGLDSGALNHMFRQGITASFSPVTIARNIDLKKAIILEELKPQLGNIVIQPHPVRDYPYGRLAAHALGYLGEIDSWRLMKLEDYGYKTKDIVGFGGVEEKYDYYLRQVQGGLSVEVDQRGRFVRALGFRRPQNGKDIQLTLDLKVQKIVEEALAEKRGCVVMMNPYTGEVIAMASEPDFEPAVFIKRAGSLAYLFEDTNAPLVNRAISSGYPAGSVFKTVVAAGILETGKINLSRRFICSGRISLGRSEFKCWDKHNDLNLIGALAHSCNVFFYKSGLLLGAQALHDYAVKLGFSKYTGVDLPYEISGFVPSPLWRKLSRFQNWFDGDTANLSIGQGELLVTPIQVCRMMAVFANGGKLVRPYILKAASGRDITRNEQEQISIHLRASTLDAIRRGLREVVSNPQGTANQLSQLPVAIAGKTGTAQAPPGYPHGWFAGFFPYENPKYVICVFLERGGAGFYAAMVSKQIIERMHAEGLT